MNPAFDLAVFSQCVGECFGVKPSTDRQVMLTLLEATPLVPHRGAPRQDPFSLVFRAARGTALGQGSYTLAHPRLGEMTLFLVPIGPDHEGEALEGVFN